MKICLGILAALALGMGTAYAAEYTNVTDWYDAEGGWGANGGGPPIAAFGDPLGSWNTGIISVIGLAYDSEAHGLWIANESYSGLIYLLNANAPHNVIRTINILAYGLTSDGNSDGIAIDWANRRILLADYQGDLNISDDIIYSIDYDTGALLDHWITDGAGNGNPNANINTILGITVDGSGQVYASDNEAMIHQIDLLPGGAWTQDQEAGVPGGGSWAELGYEPCLNQFYVANFALSRIQHHNTLFTAPLASFNYPNTTTAVDGDEGVGNPDRVYVSGFGDNVVSEREAVQCGPSATQETSWGSVKAIYR